MIHLLTMCITMACSAATPFVIDDFRQFDRHTWTCNTNSTLSIVADGDHPNALQLQVDYGKSTYSGMVKKLASPIDLSQSNALYLWARSDDTPAMSIKLVSMDGQTEMKYSHEIALKPQWREYTVLFSQFKDNDKDKVITPDELKRVRSIMFIVNRRRPTAKVLVDRMLFVSVAAAAHADEDQPRKPVTARHKADLAVLRERLRGVLLPSYQERIPTPASQTAAYAASLSADGSWPDIKYDDKSLTGWPPSKHLDIMWSMTAEYVRLQPAAASRAALKSAIDRALAFWLKRDPQSNNWWYNRIGTPQRLGKIALLLDDELTPEQRAGIVNILKRSATEGATGANLAWTAGVSVIRGVLQRSPAVCEAALEKFADEIHVAPDVDEGIKADGSFHQHGEQLYNGGYGAGFAVDASRFLYYTANTAYQFPKDKVDILTSYILDGSRWMVYRNVPDYSTCSRDIVRIARTPGLCYLAEACQQLKQSPGPRQREVAAFYEELTHSENHLAGNKHFWRSDYMVHRRADWMVSVKMLSSRMQSGEVGDGEGLRSHLLSDGVTYLYTGDGLAYHNIFPVWDWKRLPGITAEWSTEPPAGPVATSGNSDFAGGVSDGTFGACGFIHERGSLKARKAWFFFENECVALGAGIESGTDPAYTSLEQNLRNGDVTVCDGGKVSPLSGELKSQDLRWAYHRGVGYFILGKANATVRAAEQTGSWQDISRGGSRRPVSEDVFSLYIDHGAGAKGASYQYVVAPMTLAAAHTYAAKPPVRVLANTADAAAVEHPALGIVEAVFFREGSITTSTGMVLKVDKPCLLMCRKNGKTLTLSASSPFNRAEPLDITVGAQLIGKGVTQGGLGSTKVRLKLPENELAGQTASASFTVRAKR